MDQANAPELRGRMFAELAAYCHPKRRAVEVQAEIKSAPLVLEEPVTLEEAERQYLALKDGANIKWNAPYKR
jgi:hypothetical protein